MPKVHYLVDMLAHWRDDQTAENWEYCSANQWASRRADDWVDNWVYHWGQQLVDLTADQKAEYSVYHLEHC